MRRVNFKARGRRKPLGTANIQPANLDCILHLLKFYFTGDESDLAKLHQRGGKDQKDPKDTKGGPHQSQEFLQFLLILKSCEGKGPHDLDWPRSSRRARVMRSRRPPSLMKACSKCRSCRSSR